MYPISPSTRNLVWQNLLDTGRHVIYYETLSNRYQRWHQIVRLLVFLPALAGVSTLLDLVPDLLPDSTFNIAYPLVSAFIAIVVGVDFAGDYGRKALTLHMACHECSKLEAEWHKLWAQVQSASLDEETVIQENDALSLRLENTKSLTGSAYIPENSKLNRKSAKDFYQVVKGRYEVEP